MTRFGKHTGGGKPLSARRGTAFGKRIDGPAGRRRVHRTPVAMRGEMVTPSASIDVTLIDMSNTGARLHGATLPPVGQPVLVRIGPMEASGTVAWSEGYLCGVNFASPASDDEVDIARREQGPSTLTAMAPRGPNSSTS